ncbi:hypothetical protein J6590_017115, partial [Homalodisca vitripennis]
MAIREYRFSLPSIAILFAPEPEGWSFASTCLVVYKQSRTCIKKMSLCMAYNVPFTGFKFGISRLWVPSLVGVPGNELADRGARSREVKCAWGDFLCLIQCNKLLRHAYSSSLRNSYLHEPQEVVLCRLRTGR